jgi:hypothetical protein
VRKKKGRVIKAMQAMELMHAGITARMQKRILSHPLSESSSRDIIGDIP